MVFGLVKLRGYNEMNTIRFIIMVLSVFLLWEYTFAQGMPIIENKSLILARVKSVILGKFPYVELVLEVLESRSVEGYKNFVKEGDLILAVPYSLKNIDPKVFLLTENRNLLLCYYLRPLDLIYATVEFVGDEGGAGYVIREVERVGEVSKDNINDVIKDFMKVKGIIKEEDVQVEVEVKNSYYFVRVFVGDKVYNLVLDRSLAIISFD